MNGSAENRMVAHTIMSSRVKSFVLSTFPGSLFAFIHAANS